MGAMDSNAVQNPNKIFEVHRALEEGDVMAAHSRVVWTNTETEPAGTLIFKFEKDNISNLWTFGKEDPEGW